MAEEKETNQTIDIHDTDNLLCVGSLNVNVPNWYDAKANRNLERVIKALKERDSRRYNWTSKGDEICTYRR